jgi:hypothetical protein
VRQLAVAFSTRQLAGGKLCLRSESRQEARAEEGGNKLPHSKLRTPKPAVGSTGHGNNQKAL